MLSDHKLTIQDDPVNTISRFIVVMQDVFTGITRFSLKKKKTVEYIYQMILQQYLVALSEQDCVMLK